jgi:hypothetical protein
VGTATILVANIAHPLLLRRIAERRLRIEADASARS